MRIRSLLGVLLAAAPAAPAAAGDVSLAPARLFLSGIAGLEIAGRAPVRLEGRFLYLPSHPFIEEAGDSSETELLLSVSVRIPLSGR